jgi:hypothetical protein
LLPDPAAWPAPAKPYFMIAFDTSGSMVNTIASGNSCGYPNNRLGHGRCAIKNTIQAYSGQANFGLASYAREMRNCTGSACFGGCGFFNLPGNAVGSVGGCAPPGGDGCGPEPTPGATNSSTRAGANVLVGILSDAVQPPPPTNVPELLSWVDNSCAGNKELFADGCTPLNGILRDMARYYQGQWVHPSGSPTFVSPLTSVANGERACRSANVILVTDGDETCDVDPTDSVDAAADLFAGFTKDGITWKVKTFVINFAGGSQAKTDQIAAAGGTTSSFFATNATELALALSNIIGGSVKPEVCDNTDNNCNGCTDEGFQHFCDVQPVASDCCGPPTPRATCLANFQASITPANPKGNLSLLPCTTAAEQLDPATWLCFDPGEKCDTIDNNCQAGVDETVVKCGNPAHCPQTEVCNGQDDDCDGQVDELVCLGCVPSLEICDGCDNDCDGLIDEGIAAIPCGQAAPPNCAGNITCKTIAGTFPPGTCVAGGGFNACNNAPQGEACDGQDNDCDGIPDDGIAPTACVPPGTPGGIVFGGTSQCKQGTQPCNGTCGGFIGPSAEICDGIDNDCDGQVDENVPGVGQSCGINQPPCTPGTTACVGGALVCQGGTGPQLEVCDGLDNDCDGLKDEAPLADAPAPGLNGCWNLPGNCCQFPLVFPDIAWCPPTGANCNNNGTLTPPCNSGTLACAGPAGWICQGPKNPSPEACDGLDNDCNGKVDDGTVLQVGQPCGSDDGECQLGVLTCTAGVLDCVGDIGPVPETCDGKDNDCDKVIDNGLPVGGACQPLYDTDAYPGKRTAAPCQPGTLVCNVGLGGLVCLGGVGPSPEVCDGKDNDCDGAVDEVGDAPDGLDGTANPLPPPAVSIGDVCGVDTGECTQGKYACINGTFGCLGSQAPQPEKCDCLDNNCDGTTDNPNPGGPSLCGANRDCVKSGALCQCAQKCGTGEFPCAAGQTCQAVTSSDTGLPLGQYCLADPCKDCANATVKDANSNVLCAPAGTMLDNCVTPPVCSCKGQNGCQEPCFGITCPMGEVCSNFGPKAGTCTVDNCFNNPCQGCDKACNQGACVDNPCKADSCPGQVCKPSDDFKTPVCVPSCADKACQSAETCVDGACVATCSPACATGNACDKAQSPPVCVPDKCLSNPCTNGAYCDPVTGLCGNSPCEGVVCPGSQQCSVGQCVTKSPTSSSSGGGSSASSGSSSAASGSGTGSAGGDSSRGVWGLATGGGGCACEVGPGNADLAGARWALFALALAVGRLRKRTKQPRSIEGEVR